MPQCPECTHSPYCVRRSGLKRQASYSMWYIVWNKHNPPPSRKWDGRVACLVIPCRIGTLQKYSLVDWYLWGRRRNMPAMQMNSPAGCSFATGSIATRSAAYHTIHLSSPSLTAVCAACKEQCYRRVCGVCLSYYGSAVVCVWPLWWW